MNKADRDITGIFSGVLVACFICAIVLGQRPKPMECIAKIRDTNGNIHEMHGVVYEAYLARN